MLGREDRPPAAEDVGDLLRAPEPRADPGVAGRVADHLEEVRVGDEAAVLDVLLPLRRHLADEVAHGDDQVHLDALTEGRQRPVDLRRRGGREDLVADDRGAGPGADLRGQPVPRADGLGLEPAPGQPHQVERGQEVAVEAVRGIEDPLFAQRLAVAEEHVLQVGRARLGSADVEQDLLHRDPFHVSSTSMRTASASTSSGEATPGAGSVGITDAGSPTTG